MEFRVKDMDISTGGPFIAIISENDAESMDLYVGDRISIRCKKRKTIAIIDIAASDTSVPQGNIGLFEEVLSKLRIREGGRVSVSIAEKPKSIIYIKKKLNGLKLTGSEINQIIDDIASNRLDDIELAYFVSACHTHVMDLDETVALTKAMINTGDILKIKGHPIIDKHCIGGVAGNRTTPIVVSILAAAGYIIPKTSSRSITSPAGTADTMEVLAGITFPLSRIKRIVRKTNACLVWGGAINLAPADDKIIRVEHPLSIDTRSQLIASILAKKASVSATHVLVDIPMGKDTKVESVKVARNLKHYFTLIGKKIGIKIRVVFTDGSQPIGNGLGPVLEARDILLTLKNHKKAPHDLRNKSLRLSGLIFEMVGRTKKGQGMRLAREILESGRAYRKFIEIIKAQNGKEVSPDRIRLGRFARHVRSGRSGRIKHISNKTISRIARIAGAPHDKEAGVYLYRHRGDSVKKGERLYTIYCDNKQRLTYAARFIREDNGFVVG